MPKPGVPFSWAQELILNKPCMPLTRLSQLFLSDDYKLPYIEANDSKTFLHLFSKKMDKFLRDLKAMNDSAFMSMSKKEVLTDLQVLANALKEVMSLYLNGYPAEAFQLLKQTLDEDNLYQNLNYNRLLRIDDNAPFYRSKKIFDKREHGKPNKFVRKPGPRDMFHVPFEKRKAIGTNRYSIPGFPCIYLSDHLQTSWSECMFDDKQPFYAICYRNHRPLYFVDLVPLNIIMTANNNQVPNNLFSSMNAEQALINYTKVYPIICACHSKINYTEDYDGEVKFKSEYIIPQLLMQWYRDSKVLVDGIRYLSCTAETKFPNSIFDKHNFVVPVDVCEEVGLCPSLVANFSGSAVYAYRRLVISKWIFPWRPLHHSCN
jgi:hypothetical protein